MKRRYSFINPAIILHILTGYSLCHYCSNSKHPLLYILCPITIRIMQTALEMTSQRRKLGQI